MTNKELNTITAMSRFGGGFAASLANTFLKADSSNFLRLKNAFPELWEQYEKMAKIVEEKDFS